MPRDGNRTRSPGSCRVYLRHCCLSLSYISRSCIRRLIQLHDGPSFFLFISHKETERYPAKHFCCILHCQLNTRTQLAQENCYRSIHQHQWRAWKEQPSPPTPMGIHAGLFLFCLVLLCFVFLDCYTFLGTTPNHGRWDMVGICQFKNRPRALDPACNQYSVACRLR